MKTKIIFQNEGQKESAKRYFISNGFLFNNRLLDKIDLKDNEETLFFDYSRNYKIIIDSFIKYLEDFNYYNIVEITTSYED